MDSRVHLGFEVVANGVPAHYPPAVEIPIAHMAVTGQTQKSGKTTALEALITRAKLPAIAFLTKRGEASFQTARRILPYFRERTDWQFVQSILESVLRKDQQFKQPWIMRACEGAHSLADVQRRASQLEAKAKNSFSQDMYMVLAAYLEKIVPIIASLPKTNAVDIRPELSVMDLIGYPFELQILVIASTLDWIHKHENGVITVIPEAWKFVPQGRNTPVRAMAENLVREGAGLKNFVWIDSQDMAGVDKILLRACAVWLVGVQKEANEVRRALANMEGQKKPQAADVVTLGLGQFFACFESEVHKTYVQPAWMDETAASQIAAGRLRVHDAISQLHLSDQAERDEAAAHAAPEAQAADVESPGGCGMCMDRSRNHSFPCSCMCHAPISETYCKNRLDEINQHTPTATEPAAHSVAGKRRGEFPAGSSAIALGSPELEEELRTSAVKEESMPTQQTALGELLVQIGKLLDKGGPTDYETAERILLRYADNLRSRGPSSVPSRVPARSDAINPEPSVLSEALYAQIRERLLQDLPQEPQVLQLLSYRPEITVSVQRKLVQLDGSTLKGRLAILVSEKFFDGLASGHSAWQELEKRGIGSSKPNVYRELDKLAEMGFLFKLEGGYKSVPGMKVSKTSIEAAA